MNSVLRSIVYATASVILSSVSSVAHAGHTYVMPVSYDPPGTGKVPGFDGKAEFEIPYSCRPTGKIATGWVSNERCRAKLYRTGLVNLHSKESVAAQGRPLGDFSFSSKTRGRIEGVWFENGEVAGIDAIWKGAKGTGAYEGKTFSFRFVSNHRPSAAKNRSGRSTAAEEAAPTAYILMDGHQSNPAKLVWGPARCLAASRAQKGASAERTQHPNRSHWRCR